MMKDYAKNYIKEAQHAKRQALICEERARKFLDLWAKTMCPYRIGDKIKLPENMWQPHNEAFRIFNGLANTPKDTEFIVKDIVFNSEIGVNGDYKEDELSWAIILSRQAEHNEIICKINSYNLSNKNYYFSQ